MAPGLDARSGPDSVPGFDRHGRQLGPNIRSIPGTVGPVSSEGQYDQSPPGYACRECLTVLGMEIGHGFLECGALSAVRLKSVGWLSDILVWSQQEYRQERICGPKAIEATWFGRFQRAVLIWRKR